MSAHSKIPGGGKRSASARPCVPGARDELRVSGAAWAAVGVRLGSDRADAFAVGLGRLAAEERAAEPGGGGNRWARRAADRVMGALSRCELGDLVRDLGLGRVAFAGPDPGDAVDPVRDVLRHLLRDRLVDALRVSAGQRPLWCWPAAGAADEGGVPRGP